MVISDYWSSNVSPPLLYKCTQKKYFFHVQSTCHTTQCTQTLEWIYKNMEGEYFFPFGNSLIQKSWLCKCSKTKITDKERIHHVIIPTCNQATKEGTNMSAARKCKISKPCRWWNISNWVSPKLLTESGLLEQLSSDSECRFSPSPLRKANSSDLSCPFLEFNDSLLWAWLRKEAVKKLLQKQGVTFRNASHLEENKSQWHMITDMNKGTMVMTMKKRN